MPAPMVGVTMKLDLDSLTFTYHIVEKDMEADNDASRSADYGTLKAESVWGKSVEDIKPKIESSIKTEPTDPPRGNKPNKKSTADCPICHKSFKKLSQLRRHHRNIHAEKTVKCDICDKLFGHTRNLNSHKKMHLPSREKHPCDICQEVFQTKYNLNDHRKIHDLSRKLVECQICEMKFLSQRGLKRHIQRKHSTNDKKKCLEKCAFCDRQFAENISLIRHMRSEHFTLLRQQDKGTGDIHKLFQGRRTYECYRCKFSTTDITGIKSHMERCNYIYKPVKCELCKKRFTSIQSLECHMRNIHLLFKGKREKWEQMLREAEKPFECIDCKARFIGKYGLTKHIKSHCTKRGFKCNYCFQKFSQQIDKDDHERHVHPTLLKTSCNQKYECHICKVCMPVHMAIQHLAQKHQITRMFECNICESKFIHNYNLKCHKLTHETNKQKGENSAQLIAEALIDRYKWENKKKNKTHLFFS